MTEDPWREMALDRQFRPFLEEFPVMGIWPHPDYPATLYYLEQVRDRKEVVPSAMGALDHEIDQLMDALLAGEYAKALAMRVWDPDADPDEYKNYMNETLENPEVELLDRIIKQSPVFVG